MANIGDPITPSVPAPGATGPQYATDIDAILNEVVARLTKKVPLSSLDLSANLSLSGASVLDARGYTFTDLEATPAGSPSRRLATFGGDLFYVSPSGAVQVTSGAALNSAALGGITGDYGGANPAQFRFDALNARYDAFANFGTGTWADVRARGLSLAAGATSSVHARLLFAGAANKTFTFPPAAASSAERPLFIDSAGQIRVGHGTRRYSISPLTLRGSGSIISGVTYRHSSGDYQCPIDGLATGEKLTSVVFRIKKVDATSLTLEVRRNVDGVATVLGTTSTTTIGVQSVTVTLGSPHTVSDNVSLAAVSNGGAVLNDEVYSINALTTLDA